MARKRQRGEGLSAAFCRTVTEPGRYTDRRGLMLIVSSSGAKRWGQRLVIHGKRCDLGLGGFPSVSLSEARDVAEANQKLARDGGDPRAAKREKAQAPTFEKAAEQAMEVKLVGLRNAKHRDQWRSTLATYAFPTLGRMNPHDISTDDVVRVLKPIWDGKTETATRLRSRIEYVLDFAAARGWRAGDNPARWKGNLEFHLASPSAIKTATHHPALAITEASQWYWRVTRRQGMGPRALEFLALTAARSGEVRGATWGEMDLQAGVWTIPAVRMKNGRQHRVPLSPEAVALLEGLPRLEGSPLVFFAPRGGTLSDMTVSAVMRRIASVAEYDTVDPYSFCDPVSERPAVPHGVRSTFRQWVAEEGYPRDMAEIALAHFIGSAVERAYQRSDMLERRREMMAAWANFLHTDVRRYAAIRAGTSPLRIVG